MEFNSAVIKSQGCRVLGFDIDREKCNLAEEFGISTVPLDLREEPENWFLKMTNNIGVDGVIITASTNSNEPITIASKYAEKEEG